jgi:small-conductance mechanosensitive channel
MLVNFYSPPTLDVLGTALQTDTRYSLVQVVTALLVLAVAWLLVRLWRGRESPVHSVWFGEQVIDGVLFPVMTLALSVFTQYGLLRLQVWDRPAPVFMVFVQMLIYLALIRLAVRVLETAFPDRGWVKTVERTVSWMVWVLIVMWLTGVLPDVMSELEAVKLPIGDKNELSLKKILIGGLTCAIVLVLTLWVSGVIERRLLDGPADEMSMRKIGANLVRALLIFIGLMIAMPAVGIDMTTLSVLGGGLGVGLGFGLQKVTANYVSGFVILAEGSLRIGDVVKVDGFEGRVTDIATRYTVIRSAGGRESVVPNEMLISQRVESLSLADTRVQLTTVVQVAYGTDLDVLRPALLDVVRQVPRVVMEPAPNVLLSAFQADGLELTIAFWIEDPDKSTSLVRSDVNLAVLAELIRRGIEIPFPQRVIRQIPV